VISRNQ